MRLVNRTRAGRALLSWGSGRSQEEAGRLHPRGFHVVSRQLSPKQLFAAVEPWCTPMSCPLSSAMLSSPQLATASRDCGLKLLAVSDAEDGVHCLAHENLHLLAQELEILRFSGSCRILPVLPVPGTRST